MPILLSFEAAVNTSQPSVLIRADSIESPLNTASTLGEGITVPRVLSGATKLNDLTEGYLLRHFGRVLGPWVCSKYVFTKTPTYLLFFYAALCSCSHLQLDICDDDRHFTLEVVRRAPTCPLLLNACLALTARQLANTTETFSPETADYYHGRCIEILIPLLSDPDLHQEMDVILASIVILRLEEQISCKPSLPWSKANAV
jgi:hypothetical protein